MLELNTRCPFCGGLDLSVAFEDVAKDHDIDTYAYVTCGACGARGPHVINDDAVDAQAAIDLWLERAELPPLDDVSFITV